MFDVKKRVPGLAKPFLQRKKIHTSVTMILGERDLEISRSTKETKQAINKALTLVSDFVNVIIN